MRLFHWKSSIYRRLILFFISVGIVPVVLLSMMSYGQMQLAIYSKVGRYSAELMSVVGSDVERELMSLENIAIDISYSDDVQEIFKNHASMSTTAIRLKRSAIRMDIAMKVSLIREVTDVYAYFPDGERLVLYGDEGYKFSLKEEYEEDFLQRIYNSSSKSVILSYSGEHQQEGIRRQQDTKKGIEQCILMGREVRSLEGNGSVGVLIMRINERMFSSKLENIDVGTGAELLLTNGEGRVISSTNRQIWPAGIMLENDIFSHPVAGSSTGSKLTYDGQHYLLTGSIMQNPSWSVLCLIPCSYLDSETYTMSRNSILLLLAIVILIAIGVRVFSRSISRPLTELVEAMNQAEAGNLDAEVKNNSPDEIGKVSRSFNKMLQQIRLLLEDVKKQEKQKRKAELDALQAQINPHFLSNTLNTAKYLAHTQKADNIENLLVALIELLHVSMDMRQDMIPIQEEICYLKSYVEIMRYRDYSSFEISFEVQPQLRQCLVPKLILQPIVENALIHGIYNKNGTGHIIVRVTGDDQEIHIAITDNGQGIEPEKLSTLLVQKKNNTRSRFSGIGLANVNERIKLLFGDRYGLYIQSIYQMYTTVEVLIPNQKGEDHSDETADLDSGR